MLISDLAGIFVRERHCKRGVAHASFVAFGIGYSSRHAGKLYVVWRSLWVLVDKMRSTCKPREDIVRRQESKIIQTNSLMVQCKWLSPFGNYFYFQHNLRPGSLLIAQARADQSLRDLKGVIAGIKIHRGPCSIMKKIHTFTSTFKLETGSRRYITSHQYIIVCRLVHTQHILCWRRLSMVNWCVYSV